MAAAAKAVKKDVKEDVKEEEAKEEGKEESKADKKEKKEKRSREEKEEGKEKKKEKKHKKDDEAGDGNADEDDMFGVLREDVDLSTCPKSIVIEGAYKGSANGQYTLFSKVNRGYPAYEKHDAKKPMWLYFRNGWKISAILDDKKFFLTLQDAGLPTPCEPYPHVWRGFDKDENGVKHEVIAYSLRVIDAAIKDEFGEMPLTYLEAAKATGEVSSPGRSKKSSKSSPKKAVSDDAEAVAETQEAKEAKEQKEKEEDEKLRADLKELKLGQLKKKAKEENVPESKIEEADDTDSPHQTMINLIIEARKAPKIAQTEAAAEGEVQKAEKSSSEDSSESEAESEASKASESSSSSASAASESQTTNGPAAAKRPVDDENATRAKRSKFEENIRGKLGALQGRETIKSRLKQLKEKMMDQNADVILNNYGYTTDQLTELFQQLEKEFVKPPAAPPKGPPPKHLLQNRSGGAAGGPPAAAPPGGPPAPSTPPEDPSQKAAKDGDNLPHRTMPAPEKGKLKSAWGIQRTARRIGFVDNPQQAAAVGIAPQAVHEHHPVESFRHEGGKLWFQMPGMMVVCDTCSRTVPQNAGSLQGAPDRSQFAQNMFLCSNCMVQS